MSRSDSPLPRGSQQGAPHGVGQQPQWPQDYQTPPSARPAPVAQHRWQQPADAAAAQGYAQPAAAQPGHAGAYAQPPHVQPPQHQPVAHGWQDTTGGYTPTADDAYHMPQAQAPSTGRPGPRVPQPQGYGQPQSAAAPSRYAPQADPAAYAQPARGYAAQRPGAAPQDPWPASAAAQDPRAYDLNNYAAGVQQHAAYAQAGAVPVDPAYAQQYTDTQQYADAQGYAQQTYAQGVDPSQLGGQAHGYDQQLAVADGQDVQLEEDDPPSSRGRKGLMIAASLVGAIALGAGLAYGYKMLNSGGGKSDSRPQLVKSDKAPTRIAPADTGGKQFADKEKTFYERLDPKTGSATADSSGSQPASQTSAAAGDGGPKRVTTLNVTPQGQIVEPRITQPTQPLPQVPTQAVKPAPALPPGIVVEGMPRAGVPPIPTPAPQQQPQPPQQVVAAVQPQPVQRTVQDAPPAAVPVPQQPKAAAPKQVAAAPTASAPVRAAGPGGFVVWTSSLKSQEAALAEFANLKAKYGALLEGKQPDIKSIEGKDQQIWYRLRVGSFTSKDEANQLCIQLKASGLKECWAQPK